MWATAHVRHRRARAVLLVGARLLRPARARRLLGRASAAQGARARHGCISLHLPTSPYISLHLPISPYISLYLPISPCISLARCSPSRGWARARPSRAGTCTAWCCYRPPLARRGGARTWRQARRRSRLPRRAGPLRAPRAVARAVVRARAGARARARAVARAPRSCTGLATRSSRSWAREIWAHGGRRTVPSPSRTTCLSGRRGAGGCARWRAARCIRVCSATTARRAPCPPRTTPPRTTPPLTMPPPMRPGTLLTFGWGSSGALGQGDLGYRLEAATHHPHPSPGPGPSPKPDRHPQPQPQPPASAHPRPPPHAQA